MKLKNKNAISLIVLVITIIVLSILATTVILTLSNTNIITQANDTVKKTEIQQIEEAKTLMLSDGIMGYNPVPQTYGDTTITWNAEKHKVVTTSKGVVVPDGFHYVEGDKETGLVIEDRKGNQFVWVPVEYTLSESENKDDNGLYESFKYIFKRGTAVETETNSGIYKMSGSLSDDFIDDYTEEYYDMCKSVQEYHGFYIARFEAGDGEASGERGGITDAHEVVSKKGFFVYNAVLLSGETNGAIALSRNMYKNNSAIVSTLCYGVQWDAVMNFVSDISHNIVDSHTWGNYADNESSGWNYITGLNEEWKAKNIYDLAGNIQEMTMEKTVSGECVLRGGFYPAEGQEYSASYRYTAEITSPGAGDGFRVALYLK